MKMIEYFLANPYVVFGSILIACFVGYIAWRNNVKSRRADACSKFRASVLSALDGFYPIPVNWPKDLHSTDQKLRAVFPHLQTAVAEFRYFVPVMKRRGFDRAWFVYRLGENGREIDRQCYHQYMPFISSSVVNGKEFTEDNSKAYAEKFKRNVDAILSYAKET
jgi:hypothetical protein